MSAPSERQGPVSRFMCRIGCLGFCDGTCIGRRRMSQHEIEHEMHDGLDRIGEKLIRLERELATERAAREALDAAAKELVDAEGDCDVDCDGQCLSHAVQSNAHEQCPVDALRATLSRATPGVEGNSFFHKVSLETHRRLKAEAPTPRSSPALPEEVERVVSHATQAMELLRVAAQRMEDNGLVPVGMRETAKHLQNALALLRPQEPGHGG